MGNASMSVLSMMTGFLLPTVATMPVVASPDLEVDRYLIWWAQDTLIDCDPQHDHLPIRDVEAIQGIPDVVAGEKLLETQLRYPMEVAPCLDEPGLKVVDICCCMGRMAEGGQGKALKQ